MKLIFLYGAPVSGKYTVAKELANLTGYTFLHNHVILNALSDIFGFNHPARKKLEKEFRLRIIEEAVKADMNLLITGVVMKDNEDFYRKVLEIVNESGGKSIVVHLTADKETIKSRIENDSRKSMNKISTIERFEEWTQEYPESFEEIDYKDQFEFDTTKATPKETAKSIADLIQSL